MHFIQISRQYINEVSKCFPLWGWVSCGMVLHVVTFSWMHFFEIALIYLICSEIWDDIRCGKVAGKMLVLKHIRLLKCNI